MFEHRGVPINVTSNGKFLATIETVELTTESLSGLKTLIEKELDGKAKSNKRKLALKVLVAIRDNTFACNLSREMEIVKHVVIGINRTSRTLLLEPALPKGKEANWILPDTEQNALLLAEFVELSNKLLSISERVSKSRLQVDGYGRIDIDDYPKVLDKLEASYAKRAAHES